VIFLRKNESKKLPKPQISYKKSLMFICSACQQTSPKWSGKCLHCNAWNTLVEQKKDLKKSKLTTQSARELENLWHSTETSSETFSRMKSSSWELDGVLGGGMSSGSLILLSGEPGIGKSTLALQMAEWYAPITPVLYVSGEEHTGQIRARAQRLWVHHENISLLSESDFDAVYATIESSDAKLIIIDSLSVLSSSSIEGSPGSISQIRIMTEMCMHLAKKYQLSIILIGHVTKDGSISWPKSLEHLVDVVLYLEGIRTENYRILRTFKNRFGPTDAVGLFRMDEDGLKDLQNPGLEFISHDREHLSWSALTFALEGNRPILIEIEALTTYTKFWYPKRSTRGINQNRLDLLIAVLTKFTSIKLENFDTYINISRWLTITETGVDLACIAAIASSRKNFSLKNTLWLWEVSLTGIIRPILMLEKRLKECQKLGFSTVVIPASYEGKIPAWLNCTHIAHIRDLDAIFTKLWNETTDE
jgi:DNA repair protein RadA/Sms